MPKPLSSTWRRDRVCSVLLLLIASFGTASAGINLWTSEGPGGGAVRELLIDPQNPQRLYAVAGSVGLFRTTNAAASWHRWHEGLPIPNPTIALSPADSQVIYAAGFTGGIGIGGDKALFRTNDGGLTWRQVVPKLPFTDSEGVGRMFVAPDSSETIYATTESEIAHVGHVGLHRSSDGGRTWKRLRSPQPGFALAFAIDPVNPAILYLVALNGDRYALLRSSDRGESWEWLGSSVLDRVSNFAMEPSDPEILYVTTFSGGVFRSADGGLTWSLISMGLPAGESGVYALVAGRSSPTTLYASTPHGIFRSSDAGAHWSLTTSAIRPDLLVDPRDEGTLYSLPVASGADPGGIFKSEDSGTTWREVNTGLAASWVGAIAVSGSEIYAAFADRVFRSEDRGLTWMSRGVPDGNLVRDLAAVGEGPATLYAVTRFLYSSTDGGLSWIRLSLESEDVEVHALSVADDGTLYVGTINAVFRRSPDGTWRKGGALPFQWSLWANPREPNRIYAGTPFGFYRSTDGALSWQAVGLVGVTVSFVSGDPREPSVLYAVADGSLQQSRDGGFTWKLVTIAPDIGQRFGEVIIAVVDPTNSDIIYAGTERGIFRSVNGGSGWTPFNNGLIFESLLYRSIARLVVDPSGRLYAATGGQGVLHYEPSPVVTLPAVASLHGAGGAFFHSDVSVFNPSDASPAGVEATYRCFGGPCGASVQSFSVAARQALSIKDMAQSLFGAPETGGAVELQTRLPVSVTSRLYTPGPAGPTTGMFVAGIDPEGASASQVLLPLSHGEESRTNVGVFNPGEISRAVTFSFYRPSGAAVGEFTRLVGPRQSVQINDSEIIERIGTAEGLESFHGVVRGDGLHPLSAYAAVIDNQSQDPFFIPGRIDRLTHVESGPGRYVLLPAAASLHGRGGAYFHSDVAVLNLSSFFSADVAVRYRCLSGACGNSQQTFSLAPREMRNLTDIVSTLFGAPESGGAIEFQSTQEIIVASRLYTPDHPPTVGMFVPGLTMGQATLSAVLGSLSHSADPRRGFRSNVGLFNPNDSPLTLTVALNNAAGSELGRTVVSLAARQSVQVNDIFLSVGVAADVPDAYCLALGDGVHAFFSYAAVIDNQSQDPIFVPGEPIP